LVFDRLRGKKKQTAPEISRREFLKIKPGRNSALRWEKDQQGVITLFIPLKQSQKKKRRMLPLLSSPPPEKKIRLDSMGSIIWELCDGERTVKDIVQFLHEEYKMLPNEAELSLNSYFDQLSKRGLMVFGIPEETRARLEEAIEKEKKKK
jgi:hypothetical protein